MPRSGFAGAVTCTPCACSRLITSFQLEPSAKAPCTRTTEGWDPFCGFSLMLPSFPQEAGLVSPTGLANGGTILLVSGDVCAPEHKLRARTSENAVKAKFAEFIFHVLR